MEDLTLIQLGRRSLWWIAAVLLVVGCNANGTVTPQPTPSSGPPIVTARGTIAVVNIFNRSARKIWVFPPHSDKVAREIGTHGSHEPNSLAFDRRGHLYIGINDTSSGGKYHVVEFNLQNLDMVREIQVPQWANSLVAVDDENNLYVNTKSFIGGDVKIYRNDRGTSPYLEIKNHRSPVTTLISRHALWVGYEGLPNDALAQYPLRSNDLTWLKALGNARPIALAVNNDGSLLAAMVRRDSTRKVEIYDVRTGDLARTIVEGRLEAMASDPSGNLYISETGPNGRIHTCTFRGCSGSFETNTTRPLALAVQDGALYVASTGKSSVQVFDARTGSLIQSILLRDFEPAAIAVEP